MDTTTDPAEDAAVLKARRERIRAFSTRVAEAVEAIPTPETFLEAERCARTLIVADRLIVRCAPRRDPDVVKPARQRIRVLADALLDTIDSLDMPQTFLEVERAGRCALTADRLFTQLYVPPKPRHETDDPDDEDEDDPEEEFAKLLKMVENLTVGYAYECGYWPNGVPLRDGMNQTPATYAEIDRASFESLAWPKARQTPEEGLEYMGRLIATLVTGRTNAATRFSAAATGRWPDGSPCPYKRPEDVPDFYSVSKNVGYLAGAIPGPRPDFPDEARGPRCMPGWIVRIKPPPD